MNNDVLEKEKSIIIDGLEVKKLPDCPKCGGWEWRVSGDGKYLFCGCGQKFFNRDRV